MPTFRVDVVVKSNEAVAGADKTTDALKKTDAAAKSLQRSLVRAYLVFGTVRAIRAGVKTLADFEEAMATVGAVSGSSANQLDKLRETAKELGITTRFSAVQAAEGMVTLARAGFSVVESQQAIADVLNLAVAGGTDLATAADITASSLRSFGIAASDAAHVTDVLTAASNNANTTVSQLGQGIKFVGPVARGLGVSFETTSAALAKLSDAGLKATLAGTGLRGVMARLESPTSSFRKVLTQLNISAKDVQVSQVGLVGALRALRDAGIGTGQALDAFGKRAGPAFNVLVQNIDAVDKMAASLKNVDGVAAKTAKTIDDTLKGAFIRVESAYKGVQIALGEQGPVNSLTRFLENLAIALQFAGKHSEIFAELLLLLPPVIASVVTGLTGAAAGLAPALAAVAIAGVATSQIIRFMTADIQQFAKELNELEDIRLAEGFNDGVDATTRAIERLRKQIFAVQDAGSVVSPNQIAELKRLEGNLKKTTDAQKERLRVQEEEAELARTAPFRETIERLEREQKLLKAVTDEKRVQLEVDKLFDQLVGKQKLTDDEVKLLEVTVKATQAARDRNKILSELNASQIKFNRSQAALVSLISEGGDNAKIFKEQLRELREEFEKANAPKQTKFEEFVEQQEKALFAERERLGLVTANVHQRRLEVELFGDLNTATDEQRAKLNDILINNREVTKLKKDQVAAQRAANAAARERKRQEASDQRTVDQATGQADAEKLAELQRLHAEGRLNNAQLSDQIARSGIENQDALNKQLELQHQLWKDNEISTMEYGRAMKVLGDKGAKGISKLEVALGDLVYVADQVVDAFANRATDAIVEFVETGKFNFKSFAQALIKDILRIIVKLLVMKAIQAAGGGGGAAASAGTAVAGRQHGGTMQADRSYIVGEQGPELVTLGRTAAVNPNPISVPQQPPIVNVQNVTVASESMVPEAIASGAADKVILQRLTVNRSKAKKAIA